MEEHTSKGFEAHYGMKPEAVYFAPGRVNLIGEHTDYNGGYVFPCALTVGTYMAVRPREDRQIRLYSDNFPDRGTVIVDLDRLVYDTADDWANYPKGMLAVLAEAGWGGAHGFDAFVHGNIPNGAGLSSSASIELVTGAAWKDLHGLDIDMLELVRLAQKAENEFIGVNCGIMDQFAIGMGRRDAAMLLDCATLDYSYAPVELREKKLVIANTNKRRGLADSKYNERREECEQALQEIQKTKDIQHLCELTLEEWEEAEKQLSDDTQLRRARHAVTENARTIEAQKLLSRGDLEGFGQLMNASHVSLRDDYEVTGEHLDALAEAAWAQEGVIGSRMTGAGFGGCTVSLVEKKGLDDTLDAIAAAYQKASGIKPDFYIVGIGDGAKRIK
ncbi:galactokinase [Alkalicoccus chagannorensis]|uniref:galactokinase n=1 Tax=Alkalicoccus chagannorensis TaxID=427072 RepID=UPI000417E173|nr:galactokinase [Alkalicoccus chagannorensis]